MNKARLVRLCLASPGNADFAAVRLILCDLWGLPHSLQKMAHTINFAAQPAALGRQREGRAELPAEVFSMKVRWP